MTTEMELVVGCDGGVKCIYDETLDQLLSHFSVFDYRTERISGLGSLSAFLRSHL